MASSTASTPKKRKTTWKALLSDIDTALIGEALNLTEVLPSNIDADVFIANPKSCQRHILGGILGESGALIESILQSIEKNIQKQLTVVDRLSLYWLPPSVPLDEASFKAVVGAILKPEGSDDVIAEPADIQKFMFSRQPPQASGLDPATSSETSSPGDDITNNVTTAFMENMLHMRSKEACGSPLLGVLCVYLAKQLCTKIPDHVFKADMEFPVITDKIKRGIKPSYDGTVCVVVASKLENKPLILYEYKPVVDPRISTVDNNHLMEVLIQGFYCLNQYGVSTIIQCLTDLQQWYYFQVERVGSAKLSYNWYKVIHDDKLNLKSHVDFLYPVIKDMLN